MSEHNAQKSPEVKVLLAMFDRAFASEDWHSLLRNLQSVTPEDWEWTPPGGTRSIRAIVQHAGVSKLVFDSSVFGDGSLQWADCDASNEAETVDVASSVEWLKRSHERLRGSIAKLSDADLDVERTTAFGEPRTARWIVEVMIEHDIYHAGEINHLRSIHSGDDRWEYEQAQG